MNRIVGGAVLACLVLGACAAAEQEETVADAVSEEVRGEMEEAEPVPFDSIPMPDYPDARRGRLVAASAGTVDLSGSWPGRATICDDLGTLLILAEEPGRGTLILVQMPEADRFTTYPITVVEDGPPEAPAAQVGVQLLGEGGTFAFQGSEGDVYLDSLVNGELSGRISTTLREITSDERMRYAGVFSRIPVVPATQAYCDQMAAALAAPDSLDADAP